MNSNRDYRGEMKSLKLIGQKSMARLRADFSPRPKRHELGTIVDEVWAVEEAENPTNDVRFSYQKILFPNGEFALRPGYHVWEGRVRKGQSELRLGWGQFSPILPSEIANRLNEQMFFKGRKPWSKMENLVNLGSQAEPTDCIGFDSVGREGYAED